MEKVKILFLGANPVAAHSLAIDREFRDIEDKLRGTPERARLELVVKHAVRYDDIELALLENRPHIVHFSGHGTDLEELVIEENDGTPVPLRKEALLALFGALKDDLRLVVLNACFSRPQAEALTTLIDAAVGMKKEIGDAAALVFAPSFYRAIGFGRSLQTAFDLGKAALIGKNIGEDKTPEMLAPRLKPDSILFFPPDPR